MSRIESYKGKLIPVEMNGMTTDEKIKEILGTEILPDHFESWLEYLEDNKYSQYHYETVNKILYKIKKEELNPEFFNVMYKNT